MSNMQVDISTDYMAHYVTSLLLLIIIIHLSEAAAAAAAVCKDYTPDVDISVIGLCHGTNVRIINHALMYCIHSTAVVADLHSTVMTDQPGGPDQSHETPPLKDVGVDARALAPTYCAAQYTSELQQ